MLTSKLSRITLLKKVWRVLIIILIFTATIVFIIPYLWMFLSSFKTTSDIFRYTYPLSWKTFIPPSPTLNNYKSIFFDWRFGRSLLNSMIASIGQMIGTLVICSLSAYVLARIKFRGSNTLFGIIMLVAFIPFEVYMVPLFQVINFLNLQSSYFALFLPWIANPFGIFLLRQAFMEIPRDFDDAAMVEGASHFQIFWYVILPSAKPTLITLSLMSFLWSWNAFLWPLIVMQDPSKQVVQVKIATFTIPSELPAWGEIFAGSAMATIPILILFIILQRYYIKGAVLSGLKG